MYFADILEDEKEQARASGHAEGLAAGLAEGRSAGLAEGRAEGRVEGEKLKAIEAAKNFLKQNISIEIISNCLGMTAEEVTKLQAEI